MRRRRILILSVLALAALGAANGFRPAARLTYNPSPSAPRGWYWLSPARGDLERGDRVLAWPPPTAAALADRRGYVPREVPILKRVAALPGQRICRHGSRVFVEGRHIATAVRHDRAGRPMPDWRGCRTLGRDSVFLLAADRPDSFDGRYFGPVDRRAVFARARPIWTW